MKKHCHACRFNRSSRVELHENHMKWLWTFLHTSHRSRSALVCMSMNYTGMTQTRDSQVSYDCSKSKAVAAFSSRTLACSSTRRHVADSDAVSSHLPTFPAVFKLLEWPVACQLSCPLSALSAKAARLVLFSTSWPLIPFRDYLICGICRQTCYASIALLFINIGVEELSPNVCGMMGEVRMCESFTIGNSLWHHLGLVEPALVCCLITVSIVDYWVMWC